MTLYPDDVEIYNGLILIPAQGEGRFDRARGFADFVFNDVDTVLWYHPYCYWMILE